MQRLSKWQGWVLTVEPLNVTVLGKVVTAAAVVLSTEAALLTVDDLETMVVAVGPAMVVDGTAVTWGASVKLIRLETVTSVVVMVIGLKVVWPKLAPPAEQVTAPMCLMKDCSATAANSFGLTPLGMTTWKAPPGTVSAPPATTTHEPALLIVRDVIEKAVKTS